MHKPLLTPHNPNKLPNSWIMQNLRPFIAKCYRGGRSSGNRQYSRGFSSSSPTDLPKNESLMIQVAWRVGLSGYLMFKAVEGTVSLQDVKVAEDLAAEKGKKVGFKHNLNFFKPNKLQVVFYDDVDSRHPLGDFKNELACTVVAPLAGSFYMKYKSQEGQRARYMRQALDLEAELTDLAAATGKKVAISVDLNLLKPINAQAVYYDDLADLVAMSST